MSERPDGQAGWTVSCGGMGRGGLTVLWWEGKGSEVRTVEDTNHGFVGVQSVLIYFHTNHTF